MSNTSNASKNVKRFLLLFALGIAYGFMYVMPYMKSSFYDQMIAAMGCTNAQLLLKFLIQRGAPVIPKASSIERMKENLDVFGFTISKEDISFLSTLPERGWSGEHPDMD